MYKNIDLFLTILYLSLILFGLINIYSVSPEKAIKQFIWIILGIISIFFLLKINPKNYKKISFNLHYLIITLLLSVLILGKKINGTKAWINLGSFNFQPTELAKISTALCVSKIISSTKHKIYNIKIITSILIISMPVVLILLQPDIGSVLVFFSFIIVFYREEKSRMVINLLLYEIIIFTLSIIINTFITIFLLCTYLFIYIIINKSNKVDNNQKICLITFIIFNIILINTAPLLCNKILKQYHKDRIKIIFKDEFDKKYNKNVGYNLLSSKAAIASGQFTGKGFQKGTMTKGKYVPEQFTDYIFCTVGEEWGLKGGIILIILFLLLIGRIYYLSERTKNKFNRVLGYSLGSLILTHIVINLSMVMGIIPTIGIPLPFFSYGGSSLWSFTVLLFIFLQTNTYKY